MQKGDRVALAMRNLPEWPVIFFAVASIGAIVVPLNAWWTAGELEYGIDNSGAKLLFVDDERYQRLAVDAPALPALERMIVARASTPLDGRASRLEDMIGTPNDYALLPDLPLPAVANRARRRCDDLLHQRYDRAAPRARSARTAT